MSKKVTYKAMNKDFTCQGFQYEIGKSYSHDGEVEMCISGFHSCDIPIDTWIFYDPSESVFTECFVENYKDDGNIKTVSKNIYISKEISLEEAIKVSIDKIKNSAKNVSTGYSANNASTGDYAKNASTGYYANNASTGYSANNASTGDYAKNVSTGNYAKNVSAGNHTNNVSTGDYAKNVSTGNYAKNVCEGNNSAISSLGQNSTFKAVDGTWVSMAYYDENGKCLGFVTGCVGKDGLKENVEYKIENGKFVEVC